MTEIDLIVNQFILEEGRLYTLPEIYHQLEEIIRSQSSSMDEIGQIISTDASLSAKILKLANSAIYGLRTEVSTLGRALNLVGIKEVQNIILLDSLAGKFNDDKQCSVINMEDFWRRSVYLALIAKRLAKKLRHPNADRLFISAIMSRLGQLVCCATRTEEVSQILHEHRNNAARIEFNIENNILGFTYNEVSAKMLANWKVPEEITLCLQYCHDPVNAPENIKNSYFNDLSILNAATIYSGILELDENTIETTEFCLTQVNPLVNESLNINKQTIDDIFFEIELDALEIMGIIFPQTGLIF